MIRTSASASRRAALAFPGTRDGTPPPVVRSASIDSSRNEGEPSYSRGNRQVKPNAYRYYRISSAQSAPNKSPSGGARNPQYDCQLQRHLRPPADQTPTSPGSRDGGRTIEDGLGGQTDRYDARNRRQIHPLWPSGHHA